MNGIGESKPDFKIAAANSPHATKNKNSLNAVKIEKMHFFRNRQEPGQISQDWQTRNNPRTFSSSQTSGMFCILYSRIISTSQSSGMFCILYSIRL